MASERSHHGVVIIGSGFAGIGMGARLREEGRRDFVILERASDVGGVWRDNQYPGCACDVQSHLYEFSFAPNPEWTRSYAPQAEIWAYLRAVAERTGVRDHVRTNTEVRSAKWNEGARRWELETAQGRYSAEVLVSAAGALADPSLPALEGLERFKGELLHSARWNRDYDVTGKTVAVVGTGASAIQLIPALQKKVAKLIVFQRTPAWVLPRFDGAVAPWRRGLYRRAPFFQRMHRELLKGVRESLVFGFLHPWVLARAQVVARAHLKHQVRDAALREKLTPSYVLGCKRILVSDDYYPAMSAPNVEVVTAALGGLTEDTALGADQSAHQVDAVVFATGFHVTDPPWAEHVYGRDDKSLADSWAPSPRAHLGISVNGFPNFFILDGPNTGQGHTSMILMIESQIEHVIGALRYRDVARVSSLEPSGKAQAKFIRDVDEKMAGTVWMKGGCQSWYTDASGRNSTLWPGSTAAYHRLAAHFDSEDYLAK